MEKMKKYIKMISNYFSCPVLFLLLLNSSAFGQSSENYYTVAKDKVVVGDNLWIMYSVNKEDIQGTRIPLAELKKL